MFLLRQTWTDVFPQAKLYALDIKTNALDPGWPITAKVTPAIHVNPNFFKSKTPDSDILRGKQRELLELQKRKLELELAATMKQLQEKQLQDKQLQVKTPNVATVCILSISLAYILENVFFFLESFSGEHHYYTSR